MSSFGDSFSKDDTKEMQFDSNAFYSVAEAFVFLAILYSLIKLYNLFSKSTLKYLNKKEYSNCECSYCKKRLGNIVKKKEDYNRKEKVFYIGLTTLLILIFSILSKKIILTKKDIKRFNPYEILELQESSNLTDIKKSYKSLAKKYHPDKNPNNLQAKAKFMLVTKAYEALTDEKAKKNMELYGNTEGNRYMKVGVGLPAFIIDKKNHVKILVIFIIILCVIIPYYFAKWFRYSRIYNEYGLFNGTKNIFMKFTNKNSNIDQIPFFIAMAHEYEKIENDYPSEQLLQISELFNKYKDKYPKIVFTDKNGELPKQENPENIFYNSLDIHSKKACAILYCYMNDDTENESYKKLTNKDKYLELNAKLLDLFFSAIKTKYFSWLEVDSASESFPEKKAEFENSAKRLGDRVTLEFFKHLLIFTQCFYQGIPLNHLKNNISYCQLPNINYNNFEATLKENGLKFRNFIKLKEDEQKNYISNTFPDFTKEQINDIIIATKSIPKYEVAFEKYVDGFEKTEVILNDFLTVKLIITKKDYNEKLKNGFMHSKCYPFNFCETFFILVYNEDKLISAEKIQNIETDNNKLEYLFRINMANVGKIPLKFYIMPTVFFGQNLEVSTFTEVVGKGEKREEMLKDIKNRKVKLELSYVQKVLKENGFNIGGEEDEEEEEEEDEGENKTKATEDDEQKGEKGKVEEEQNNINRDAAKEENKLDL